MKTFKLKILIQNWSGWSPNKQEPVEKEVEINEGEPITFDLSKGYEFVLNQENNAVMLSVIKGSLTTRNESGTINLQSQQDKIELIKDVEIELVTTTMDAGTSFKFTLLEIKDRK